MATVARRHGLSHAALNALAVIEAAGGPLRTGEVGAQMHITTGTTTAVLDTLERGGYIRRSTDPDDRRKVLVDITPDAQALLDEMLPEVQQLITAVTAGIGDDVLEDLLGMLTTVHAAVDAAPEDLSSPLPRRPPGRLRRT